MRFFSYRNKTRLKSAFVVLSILAAVLLLLLCGVFIYMQRFIVYTADGGIHLDFSRPDAKAPEQSGQNWDVENSSGQLGLEIQDVPTDDGPNKISGFYISTAMLADPDAVSGALAQEQTPATVMVDMKSIFGNFYYETAFPGATTASADLDAVASIVQKLKSEEVYLIARIPAFSDNTFALANQSCGLPLASGALWMDSNGCYWLDPGDDLVVYYLESIAKELAAMGFDEVLFDGFSFPDSDSIVYPADHAKEETLAGCAARLKSDLEETDIGLSFGSQEPKVASSAYRIYFTSADGADAAELAGSVSGGLSSPQTQIVFITSSRDTRFQDYGILRPLLESGDR